MAMRRNVQVLALVGSGHTVSHLYLLALPPLFPILRDDLGASYAALGFLVTMFNITTGAAQIPAGFLVDRFGARRLLLLGLGIMGAAITALGFAPTYWLMLVLIALAGIGNSVFHPADYAILTASVDRGWLGRAFAIHTFAGNLGFVLAPATMIALTAWLGWRGALSAAGLVACGTKPGAPMPAERRTDRPPAVASYRGRSCCSSCSMCSPPCSHRACTASR